MQSIWCKHQIIYSYPHTFLWFVLFILYAVLIVCIVPACMLPVSCLPLCIFVFSFCALCCYACPNYYYIIFFFFAFLQKFNFMYLVCILWWLCGAWDKCCPHIAKLVLWKTPPKRLNLQSFSTSLRPAIYGFPHSMKPPPLPPGEDNCLAGWISLLTLSVLMGKWCKFLSCNPRLQERNSHCLWPA